MFKTRSLKLSSQIFISISLILLVALVCFLSHNYLAYRLVALILLMSVSILAMLFDIIPVLIACLLSALIWNYFFIPPLYTFHISNAEDALMFFLYFFIALVNAVLTFKIREEEKKSRDKEEKEKTIKLYNTLINSLTHEIRTPIATIIGAVDTLKEGYNKLSDTNKFVLLNQIEIATIRLNKQVDNLLNMNRLDSGLLKLNLVWCDVNELVNLCIQKFEHNDSHKIVFNPDEKLPICKLDGGLIQQAIFNVISNATLYTPNQSIIQIKIEMDDNVLIIKISDHGQGVSSENLASIFDKFYRVPHTKTGGTGLGLSIVKGIVEAHNGQIHAENNTPSGLIITIELPVETSYLNNLKNE